jgi:uncharacterized protein (DUF2235 family)
VKRIAVFCDGTWNRSDADYPTNVMRLARSIHRETDDGVTQQVVYVAGVGSGRGSTSLCQAFDRLVGGVFGSGLTSNIEEAYWHLSFNYKPGDEIYIFGYSRGAFTARSLAGLIRSCGIPPEDQLSRIPEAIRSYQARGAENHPDAPNSLNFRSEFSPTVATSERDVDSRKSACYLLRIRYLGVWDTVGSLGVPNQLFISKYLNRRHEFHNHALSSSVNSARHAVAVDERRKNFLPTLWDNLDDLNNRTGNQSPRYRQEWFPGEHGSIGGGGDIREISDLTLDWISNGAREQGLVMDEAVLREMTNQGNPLGNIKPSSEKPTLRSRVMSLSSSDRAPPKHKEELADATLDRLNNDPSYRPATLKPFWPER